MVEEALAVAPFDARATLMFELAVSWIEKEGTPVVKVAVVQLDLPTTFHQYVCPAVTFTCRLVPVWFARNGGFELVPK